MPNEWIEVKISGLDELQRKLEALPEKIAIRGIRKALRAAAIDLRDKIVAAAPKRTGFLADHFGIRTSMRTADLAGSVYIGPDGKMDYPDTSGGYREKKDRHGRIHRVGRIAVASVARYLEFGTSRMGRHPFMTPTWESEKSNALETITETLREEIEKAAKED